MKSDSVTGIAEIDVEIVDEDKPRDSGVLGSRGAQWRHAGHRHQEHTEHKACTNSHVVLTDEAARRLSWLVSDRKKSAFIASSVSVRSGDAATQLVAPERGGGIYARAPENGHAASHQRRQDQNGGHRQYDKRLGHRHVAREPPSDP